MAEYYQLSSGAGALVSKSEKPTCGGDVMIGKQKVRLKAKVSTLPDGREIWATTGASQKSRFHYKDLR